MNRRETRMIRTIEDAVKAADPVVVADIAAPQADRRESERDVQHVLFPTEHMAAHWLSWSACVTGRHTYLETYTQRELEYVADDPGEAIGCATYRRVRITRLPRPESGEVDTSIAAIVRYWIEAVRENAATYNAGKYPVKPSDADRELAEKLATILGI